MIFFFFSSEETCTKKPKHFPHHRLVQLCGYFLNCIAAFARWDEYIFVTQLWVSEEVKSGLFSFLPEDRILFFLVSALF